MRKDQVIRVLLAAAVGVSLSGCGVFSTDDPPNYKDPYFPDKTVARMEAGVTTQNNFADADKAKTATFRATLYDADGQQFYGPEVTLDGESVAHTDNKSSTVYQKADMDYAEGRTWTAGVQGHTLVSPPGLPPILLTSPVKSVDPANPANTLNYHRLEAGSSLTIKWTGGDPSRPVYIFVYGNPDGEYARRLFVADDTSKAYRDPLNFGLPLANTGEYTIPATVVERYGTAGGSQTRTVTVFDNPTKKHANPANDTVSVFYVYVLQRDVTTDGTINFSVVSAGTVGVGVPPYKTQ